MKRLLIFASCALFLISGSLISGLCYSAEQVVKEETTPPAADGPLTLDKIPPVSSVPPIENKKPAT